MELRIITNELSDYIYVIIKKCYRIKMRLKEFKYLHLLRTIVS